jgi:hypothetical protein
MEILTNQEIEVLRNKVIMRMMMNPQMTSAMCQNATKFVARFKPENLAAIADTKRCNDSTFVAEFERILAGAVKNLSAACVPQSDLPPIENLKALLADESCVEPIELIKGLLHLASKMAIVAPSKAGKTWTLLVIALCIAEGIKFLGMETTKGKVLLINFEIQRPFLKSRMSKIRAALGITTDSENLDVWTLRGKSKALYELIPAILEQCKGKNYCCIIIDPLYKCLGGRDENSAADMGELCCELDTIATETGASVLYAGHMSKGDQSGKSAMDRMSGSGVPARDADSMLMLTAHKEPGCYTCEGIQRNRELHAKFVVEMKHPVLVRRDDLDPEELQQARAKKSNPVRPPSDATLKLTIHQQAIEKRRAKLENKHEQDCILYRSVLGEYEDDEPIKTVGLLDIISRKFKEGKRPAGYKTCEIHKQKMVELGMIQLIDREVNGVYRKWNEAEESVSNLL